MDDCAPRSAGDQHAPAAWEAVIGKRLRLLKVIVQPVFVLDDDEVGLTEHIAQPVEVPAHEWPTYASTQFVSSFQALQQQIESDPSVGPVDT